ncbi:hypothetical protein LJK88_26330 [Paenibacillus sp. P26]|nr:hypothetical protein LJK88_26330 [Paenibacillus sp. P26]UUZ95092.1 hypothetical protein LJK87_11640 [Paenibacillus sp. P25]
MHSRCLRSNANDRNAALRDGRRKDFGNGDITTMTIIPVDIHVKEDGLFAGLPVAELVFGGGSEDEAGRCWVTRRLSH